MVFSALDQSLCWTSHEGWMGEFRKAWQQRCIDVNERNHNEQKKHAFRTESHLPWKLTTIIKKKNIMKTFIADSVV